MRQGVVAEQRSMLRGEEYPLWGARRTSFRNRFGQK